MFYFEPLQLQNVLYGQDYIKNCVQTRSRYSFKMTAHTTFLLPKKAGAHNLGISSQLWLSSLCLHCKYSLLRMMQLSYMINCVLVAYGLL